ncbi:MAG: hypothetical protein KME11_05170 [Timaviella obliquedivisa GSE-PSE-MK23-08B]|jgi:phage tail-like protein|nr:hypothetical protein [Timaviella obliquedivisa GSE-PSE-MK23-08B]
MSSKPSPQIIENLPLYARLVDEAGTLEHIANAFQPQYDSILNRLDQREIFFNPSIAPAEWLDWLGQFVGLATIDGHWLGTGLNPKWTTEQKRRVIYRAIKYFANKGNEWGIREAIALWLQWDLAHENNQLILRLPFGETMTSDPPQWFHYHTDYAAPHLQTWVERQYFGSGDYEQFYQPNWFSLQGDSLQQYDQTLWSDRVLEQVAAPILESSGSGLGTQRPWMHFFLREHEWNKIFPDIITLNPEIWGTHAEPEVFGWLSYRLREPLVLAAANDGQEDFLTEEIWNVDGFQYGDLWYFEPGVVSEWTEIEVVTESFGIAPGQGHEDHWDGEETPTQGDRLYYVPYGFRSRLESVTRSVVSSCTPGMMAEIVTLENQLIPGLPAEPPNQLLDQIPAYDYTLFLPDVGFIDLWGAEVDLLPALELPEITLAEPARYQWLTPPIAIQFYEAQLWNEGHLYYSGAKAATPDRTEQIEVFKSVQMCNLRDNYSLRFVEIETVRIPLPEVVIPLAEVYPILGKMLRGDNWVLSFEIDDEIYTVKPCTMFWQYKDEQGVQQRSLVYNPAIATSLYLEFLITPHTDGYLYSYNLLLDHESLQGHDFVVPLALSKYQQVGIRFNVALITESGAETLEDDIAISDYLVSIWDAVQEIAVTIPIALPDTVPPITAPNIMPLIPEEEPAPTAQSLRDLLLSTRSEMAIVSERLNELQRSGARIMGFALTGGVITAFPGTTRTVFQVSTGLGHNRFAVIQTRSTDVTQQNQAEPEIRAAGIDGLELTFWAIAPIPDGLMEVWIAEEHQLS